MKYTQKYREDYAKGNGTMYMRIRYDIEEDKGVNLNYKILYLRDKVVYLGG